MKPYSLPKSLMLGVGTSAFQIEGNETNHSWYRWSMDPKNIVDGTNCSVACDHYNRIDEDIKLLKKLNIKTYRFGIEWSRIEPEEGKFSKEGIDHYRNEIQKLLKNDIKPLITLHHFSNPLWMEDSGSWINKNSIKRFERYTQFTVESLGDLVSDWITINEPNIYLALSYMFGTFPPGKKSYRLYKKGARNMIEAHILSYKKIHEVRNKLKKKDTMVGVAHHIRLFDPKRGSAIEKWICKKYDTLFHDIFLTGMSEGKLLKSLGKGYPHGKGEYQDFLGINYYSRDIISFNILKPFKMIEVKEGAPVNDLGWEIYPEGLYRVCKNSFERFKKPIFITENGTCDFKDSFRPKFIIDHLEQVTKLIEDGVELARYYHWSLMDNFELAEGLKYRFGLYHVDFNTLKRTSKKSGDLYSKICKGRKITKALLEEYI